MTNPRIHLAIDNCFASKRWTNPIEWARIVQQLGLGCVEASADNECDPLYADPGYLCDRPFYLTVDTGHQFGQRKFLRPTSRQLREALQILRVSGKLERGLWLGPDAAYTHFRRAAAAPKSQEEVHLQRVEEEMDRYPYFFASFDDGDTYLWLRRFACYSPIIHLQQTDGKSSSHRPFTEENNRQGIIRAEEVLRAMADSYNRQPEPDMPPRCEEIYLTLEIFSSTADLPNEILERLAESVAYWRRYIPKDGLSLEELL